MARYEHQGGAKATTLSTGISSSSTSFSIADATGWPTGTSNPFWVVIDRGKAAEEKILCSSRSGTTVTVSSRGEDGTSASDHDPGASVEHCLTALEIDKFDAVVEDPAANWTQGNAAYAPIGAAGVRAFASAAQSIVNGTETALTFDTESFDTGSFHDNTTDNHRLTLTAGKWLVVGQVSFSGNATGVRQLRIRRDGSVVWAAKSEPGISAVPNRMQATAVITSSTSFYVELLGYQTSGGALDTVAGTAETWFAATRIGD